jgi:hypothetical protein
MAAAMVIGRVGSAEPTMAPSATENPCTTAVAKVMPINTARSGKRVAKVRAMSWLLSPSSATKMTPKLNTKALNMTGTRYR